MSPELETLEQLQGGSLPLPVVRGLYVDETRFVRAIAAMLNAHEVRLLDGDGSEVPRWRRHEALTAAAADVRLAITESGARRIR